MTVEQTILHDVIIPVPVVANPAEIARHGVFAVFRLKPIVTIHHLLNCVERRDRIVLLLLDGRRTLRDVARLIHRNEVEVARVLVRLLKRGYIDFLARPENAGESMQWGSRMSMM
ncbi:MAG: hypothetical protein PVS3B1_14950 [Ktedonobacteraceae bacterium]